MVRSYSTTVIALQTDLMAALSDADKAEIDEKCAVVAGFNDEPLGSGISIHLELLSQLAVNVEACVEMSSAVDARRDWDHDNIYVMFMRHYFKHLDDVLLTRLQRRVDTRYVNY